MKKMKALNLYACLGGNRLKWDEVAQQAGIELHVTAVELDPELARMYQERFPNDTVVVSDAHQYLLEHHKEFDFIWGSPPCPTHSKARFAAHGKEIPTYPSMILYEEIIFLQHYFKGKFTVENVIPYYEPLIPGIKRGRHIYWTNFNLPNDLGERKILIGAGKDEVKNLCKFHDYDFYQYKGTQSVNKIARNLVDYEAGKTIFSVAVGIYEKSKTSQLELL